MNLSRVKRTVLILFGILAVTGGACGPEKKDVPEPVMDGKTDVLSEVNYISRLEFGGEATGEFVNDFQFDAFTFQAGAGSRVTIDTTHSGTTAALDNTLFLYGPADDRGEFNAPRIAMDDDSGWGKHARIKDERLDQDGTYLVVVGTADGQGRGRYRLVLDCLVQDCAPEDPEVYGCPGDVEAEFSMCMESAIYDDIIMQPVALENCLDKMWDVFYDECDYQSVPEYWCAVGEEGFETAVLPACVVIIEEEYPPEDLETCDPDVLVEQEECVENEMVMGKTKDEALQWCADESFFYDLASYLCEYQSPHWCRYDFFDVWDRMMEDCLNELADLSPLLDPPDAARIEEMTRDAVSSYFSWEDEGVSCEMQDFAFEGFDTEKNADDQVYAIIGISTAEGPVNYCAGYTTYQCHTEFKPWKGEWIETETDCEDLGYDE